MRGYQHDPINGDAWMDHANCLGMDPDMFFPVRGGDTKPARRICASCPVRDTCLEYALQSPGLVGIWGGTSERDRQKIRGARRKDAA